MIRLWGEPMARETQELRPLDVAIYALTALVLGMFVFLVCMREVRTPDVFFHLHVGDVLIATGQAPAPGDLVAFPSAEPFVDVEWGFQVVASSLYSALGVFGLFALRAVLVAFALGAVAAVVWPLGPLAVSVAVAGMAVVGSARMLIAPELVSIALLACTLVLVERTQRWRWLLVPITLLWVNCHGFFALGLCVVLVAGVCELWREGRWQLIVIGLVCVGATILNPYGLAGALYPYHVVAGSAKRAVLAAHIVELQSPWSQIGGQVSAAMVMHWLTMVVGGVAAVASVVFAKTLRDTRSWLLAIALLLGAGYVRNVGLMATLVWPLSVCVFWGLFANRIDAVRSTLWRRLATLAVGASVATAAVGVANHRYMAVEDVGLGVGIAPALDHSAAAQFCLDNKLVGPMWCDFGSGHALIYHSAGQIKPVLCGQTDLYDVELLSAFGQAAEAGGEACASLVQRWPAPVWFVNHRRFVGTPLVTWLLANQSYGLAYLDAQDAVFVRRDAPQAAAVLGTGQVVSKLLARPPEEDQPSWLESWLAGVGLGEAGVLPWRHVSMALFALSAGEDGEAVRLAQQACNLAPTWPQANFVLGLAAKAAGDLGLAKRALRKALAALPDSAAAWHQLGLVHLALLEYGRAQEMWERAFALAGTNATYRENLRLVYLLCGQRDLASALGGVEFAAQGGERHAQAVGRFNEGLVAASSGQEVRAEQLYREAVALSPGFVDPMYNLGNLLYRRGRLSEAAACFEAAAVLAPGDVDVCYNLAAALFGLGQKERARAEIERLLKLNPGHGRAKALLRAMATSGTASSGKGLK